VEVIGRAAGWDRSDELRDLGLDQFSIPAIAGLLDRRVRERDSVWPRHSCLGWPKDRQECLSYIHLQLLTARKIDPDILREVIQNLITVVGDLGRPVDHAHRDGLAVKLFSGAQIVQRGDHDHGWIML